jgi:hypothetical protein
MSGGDEAGGCLTVSAERPAAAKGESGGHDAEKGRAWGFRQVTSGAAGATHEARVFRQEKFVYIIVLFQRVHGSKACICDLFPREVLSTCRCTRDDEKQTKRILSSRDSLAVPTIPSS